MEAADMDPATGQPVELVHACNSDNVASIVRHMLQCVERLGTLDLVHTDLKVRVGGGWPPGRS